MKRFLLALSFVFAPLAHAEEFSDGPKITAPKPTEFVVDAVGKKHGLGLLPKKPGAEHGVTYWAPKLKLNSPTSLDLRSQGLVAPVKNQGQCGSCYAFSIVEALEGAVRKAGGQPKELGPQELVSCDTTAYGCGGGFMSSMDYVVKKGVSSEADYPYSGNDTRCKNPLPARAAKGVKWGYCGAQGREPTLAEVKQCLQDFGVLSVTVAAGGSDWSNGGHMKNCRVSGVNHMVTLAGWLDTDELIIRNSWDDDWGDNGDAYAKLGCDELGSGPESVSWVQVESQKPSTVPVITLPIEIDVHPGTEIAIGRHKPETGVVYSWYADGVKIKTTNSLIYVTPTKNVVYKVTATNALGTAESSVQVKVLDSAL